MNCEFAQRALHDAHDGASPRILPDAVRAHLASCTACHDLDADLTALAEAFRSRPVAPLPPDALEAVWRETIRARPVWRYAAAAVFALAVATTTLFFTLAPVTPPGPTAVELAHAVAQADLVFGYTGRALTATRRAAEDRVLASKVSPAVRGVAASHPPRRP